jgi:adenosylmethionine-8-amino-7-oxononanoate aminotransferase
VANLSDEQIEFVEDKVTKAPFPAERKIAPSVHAVALQDHCLSLIPSTGMADGRDGDIVQIAPPYNVTHEELDLIVERTAAAIEQVLGP